MALPRQTTFPYGAPPEIMQEILEQAVYDESLIHSTPSWKWWDMSINPYDGSSDSDPWPKQAPDVGQTIRAISTVSKSFRSLSLRYLFRQLVFIDLEEIERFLRSVDPEITKWTTRLAIQVIKATIWVQQDSMHILSLVERCPNLKILSNEIIAPGENHRSGELLLRAALQVCPNLCRIHWRPIQCFEICPKSWTEILGLATNLEALDLDCAPALPSTLEDINKEASLTLLNLRWLRLSINEMHSTLVSEVAQWQLPKLEALYLKSQHHPSIHHTNDLLTAHSKNLTSIALDSTTSLNLSLPIVVQHCTDSLRELVFHSFSDAFLHPEELPQGSEFPALSSSVATIVLVVDNVITYRAPQIGDLIVHALSKHRGLRKAIFPALERIVVLCSQWDDSMALAPVSYGAAHRDGVSIVDNLRSSGVEVVTRNGDHLILRYSPRRLSP